MATDDRLAIFAILPNGKKKLVKKVEPSLDRNQLEREAHRLSLADNQGIRYEVNAYINNS
jgi:hypothetical protein